MGLLQILAALSILFAFALAQIGRLPIDSMRYLAANAGGAGILAVSAYAERQWGFFVLETSWAAVSLWGLLVRVALGRAATHATLVVAEAPHRVSLSLAQRRPVAEASAPGGTGAGSGAARSVRRWC